MNKLTRIEKEQIKAQRRDIKSKILQLEKANEDIFKLWAYKKVLTKNF